jgi:phosphodiesterase/alkaline phosphatase D-like protein
MDAWDRYEAQRNRIVERVAEEKIENFVVPTGNVHGNWASEILTNFNEPDSSRSVGAEFVGTSITSGGDGSDVLPGTVEPLDENRTSSSGTTNAATCAVASPKMPGRPTTECSPPSSNPERQSPRSHPSR